MRAAIATLGCKANQFESQALEALLRQRGHTVVPFSEEADAYIVNTCSVTAESDRKSMQLLRRVRREHPAAVAAVCGCCPQTHGAEGLDADVIGGTGDRRGFVELVEQAAADRKRRIALDDPRTRRTFESLPAVRPTRRTRAMLKIEDGCANFCTYCVIPYARGPVRSLPQAPAVEQAMDLAAQGIREIVLTGIEISSWGRDLPEAGNLADLTEALCAAVPDTRIRLGSLEAGIVTEDFCKRLSRLPNLCPQFHLSLQSGCDDTLRRMGRKYDTAQYAGKLALLRRFFPRPAVTTDLIVGFPGETEAEFDATLSFLRACGFARTHVFPYSPRPGTAAASMEGQIPGPVKEARARQAGSVAAESQRAYLEGCVGETYDVLFEQDREGASRGHAPNYAEVRVSAPGLRNLLRPVRIRSTDGKVLYGELIQSDGEGRETP